MRELYRIDTRRGARSQSPAPTKAHCYNGFDDDSRRHSGRLPVSAAYDRIFGKRFPISAAIANDRAHPTIHTAIARPVPR